MEIVVELVVQLVLELLGELVVHLGFRGARAVWRSFAGRVVVNLLAGFAFGAWWAERLERSGRVAWPNLLWVSLFLAAAATLLAFRRWLRHREETAFYPNPYPDGAPPWQWNPARLLVLAALNAGLAAGVLTFFSQMPA